jgi:ElaB/YqjD/DUF883 family membrane-anchored ribosome-binding protein
MSFELNDAIDRHEQASVEELKRDLAALRMDVERLCGVISELTLAQVEGADFDIGDAIETALDEAARVRVTIREHLNRADTDIREYIRENPFKAALMCTTFGYIVGRLKR